MYSKTLDIIALVNRLVSEGGTRDPNRLAAELGIEVLRRPFKRQRGAYMLVLRQPFIFLKEDLDPVMERIVLSHELGHHLLHRDEAEQSGGFREFNIFDMRDSRMEYEANIFASQMMLPDDEVLEHIGNGYDIQQIAAAMESDINLVALKIDTLISQGYLLRRQEHRSDFLKYNR